MIFTELLPDDYIKKSTEFRSKFNKIKVKVLSHIDIICSKISRFNEADMEDIRDCIKYAKITKEQLAKRASQYSRAGNDETFRQNLDYIIGHMF